MGGSVASQVGPLEKEPMDRMTMGNGVWYPNGSLSAFWKKKLGHINLKLHEPSLTSCASMYGVFLEISIGESYWFTNLDFITLP